MRVNINESRSDILRDCPQLRQSPPSSTSIHHGYEAQSVMNESQHNLNQGQLPSGEASRIHCKHTLV